MLKRRKITNCKNCNKPIEKKEETYNGLCFKCYKEYLMDKIEHLYDNDSPKKISYPTLFDKIKKFLKG